MQTIDPTHIERLAKHTPRDSGAFGELYRLYMPFVYRYIFAGVNNTADAEDLTTRVFMDALESLMHGNYGEKGKFTAWLFTIVRRRLVDYYRSRLPLPLDETLGHNPDFHLQIDAHDAHARLGQLLAALDEDKRELIRLRYAGGLSFAEIAAVDGRSEDALKMVVHRAIKWMREHWEDDNERLR